MPIMIVLHSPNQIAFYKGGMQQYLKVKPQQADTLPSCSETFSLTFIRGITPGYVGGHYTH